MTFGLHFWPISELLCWLYRLAGYLNFIFLAVFWPVVSRSTEPTRLLQ